MDQSGQAEAAETVGGGRGLEDAALERLERHSVMILQHRLPCDATPVTQSWGSSAREVSSQALFETGQTSRVNIALLRHPLGIPPQEAAHHHHHQQEQADGVDGPESNLKRRLWFPPELCGGRVGGCDEPDHRGKVLCPECTLSLSIV